MSAVAFDPYYKWLGIPKHKQPPDHYRLLGIDQFEPDPQVIEAAADRQMAFLRKYQSGEHSADAQKLLNEIARARLCLLKEQSKLNYDEELRGEPLSIIIVDDDVTAAGPESQTVNSATIPGTPVSSEPKSVDGPLQLIITLEDGSTRNWSLVPDQTCLIGRAPIATLRISDPYISRTHCQIEGLGNRWVVTDLDSSMGTFVNGKRIRRAVIEVGDQIKIGHTRMQLAIVSAAPRIDTPDTIRMMPAPTTAPAPAAPPATDHVEDFVGKTIHHYCIERVLAQSAESTVYLARQVELQRDVAVRILNPTADQNDPWRRNLVNDVKTFIRIKHPNLVRMYAAGRVGPFCWLAMEYVPGDNLAHVIDGIKTTGVPDWHVALQIALDIAKALEVAESNEIVHRHLTPKNILIRSTDKVAKLADLMRARTTTNTTGSAAAQSKSVLELAYLSPEQIEDNSKADNRSDIYCLGAAIYGLLTGTPPYEAESVSQLIAKLKSDQPRPPSQVQPTMSDEFEAIVLRVLARNPANRYQSAKLLTADLKKLAAAEKTT